jgi:hypothetical protein
MALYLGRTNFVLQISKEHIDTLSSTDPKKGLLGVLLAFLVCISFYSEMEIKVAEIVRKRLSGSGDVKVANLIANTQNGMLARLKKTDLAKCASLFGEDVGKAFNEAVHDQDVTLYGNLVTQRHSVAHSDDGELLDWSSATLSLSDVELGLAAAERLLTAFETAIQ